MGLTTAQAAQLKADIGVLIDTVTDAPPPSPPPPPPPPVQGIDFGPGVVYYDEIMGMAGDVALNFLPGTTMVYNGSSPNPAMADGGIMTMPGCLFRAVSLPGQAPIKFVSNNPTGLRGHLMWMGAVDIRGNVVIEDMGRTRIDPLNPTTNKIGRYAAHHHMAGDAGYQSVIDGLTIYDTVSPSPYRNGLAIHATNGGTYRNIHVYEKGGSGIYVEDGSERDNVIENFTCEDIRNSHGLTTAMTGSPKPTERGVDDRGWEGAGLYLRSVRNFVRNGTVRRCAIGAEIFMKESTSQYQPITQLSDMVIEDCWTGFEPWYVGCDVQVGGQLIPQRQYADRFTIRRCHVGVFDYYCGRLTRNDWVIENCNTGITANDYRLAECEWIRPMVSGCSFAGFYAGTFIDNGLLIADGIFSGNGADVFCETLWSSGDGRLLPPRLITLRNNMLNSAKKIQMVGASTGKKNYILSSRLRVEQHQGNPNDNFNVYFNEQSPTTLLPVSNQNGTEVGSPYGQPQLNNQDNLTQRGICWAGELLPANATTKTGIVGGKAL